MTVKPEDVIQQQDGFYYKEGRRYCEDCWQPIPHYVDFPLGLVSPESSPDRGGNGGKFRMIEFGATEYSRMMPQPLRKAVDLDCYIEAFRRVYPNAQPPELSRLVRETTEFLQPEPTPQMEWVGEPRG